jgi:serine/threonine protein kinase
LDTRAELPADSILDGSYRIRRKIGSGGFGLTYEADDLNLGNIVAIKEYYPIDFGNRAENMSVRPRSGAHEGVFAWGRSNFITEAQTLARFRHPSIVRVTRIFEEHDTAYMVMDFEQGQSFDSWLNSLGRAPTQQELDRLVGPLLDALEFLHKQNFLHRDIAPDNILIRSDGAPVLLDFGSARRALAEKSHTLTRIVKAGYSPHEQYAEDGRLQGPWTDIYALGALLYRSVMGRRPEDATSRIHDDTLVPARSLAGDYRTAFLVAIDRCLTVPYKNRPQSIAELRPALLSSNAPAQRLPLAPLAAGVLVLIGAGYAGWHYGHHYWQKPRDVAVAPLQVPGSAPQEPAIDRERNIPRVPSYEDVQPPKGAAPEPSPTPSRPAPSDEIRKTEPAPRVDPAEKAKPEPKTASVTSFDGSWTFTRSVTERCGQNGSVFSLVIAGGVVYAPGGKGTVSPAGEIHFPGAANVFTGTLSGNTGSGRYQGKCIGTFTARKR